jgi:hypothetical protein
MEGLINPKCIIGIEVYKRFTKKYKAYSVICKPGEKYVEKEYLFGLIKIPSKVATDYVYQSVWDIYTKEEVINSFGKEEFDKKFELDSDGTIYFKPHVEIVIKDSGYNEFKYFNSNQELLDWIDTELEKGDLKLKTKWINI